MRTILKIFKNYLYNTSYQLLTILLPIITVPYVSRTLGAAGIGKYAYINSIVQEVTLVGTLGITNFAIREIAYSRENRDKLSQNFTDIFSFQVVSTLISTGIYLFVVYLSGTDNWLFFAIQSIFIISSGIDLSWLFIGLEDFKKTVVRNTLVKIIGFVLILTLVHSSNDLLIYMLILSLTQFFGQVTMFSYLRKTVTLKKPKWHNIQRMLLPIVGMFIPQVAVQIYSVVNKTMLGIMQNNTSVGFFDNADKIVRIALQVLISISAVLYPHISSLFAKGETKTVKNYLYKTFNIVSFVSIPMVFGLIAISKWFVPWFFGTGFNPVIQIIAVLSPLMWIISMSTIVGSQFLLPTKNVRLNTIAVVAGALVSVIANLLLIPKLSALGAAISSVIAEGVALILNLIFLQKFISIRPVFQNQMSYAICSAIMSITVYGVGNLMGNGTVWTILVQGLVGIVLYLALLITFKRDVIKQIKTFIIRGL